MYNTVLLLGRDGKRLGLFDKIELLAFGETIPFAQTFPFILDLLPFGSMFTRGNVYEHLLLENGVKLLPMICYEDIIPSLPRRIWDRAGPAHALVNVTNDSWYGDSHEPLMHLAMAAFRSIETRRSLIRATNTGISAFVDTTGRIYARTGQWTQETLIREVPIIADGSQTLYLVIGDLLVYMAWAVIIAGFIRARRRTR
jgi:apolipoprotein N-acyltransferase